MAAGSALAERPMEERIARLESDVDHLRTHMADVKAEVRALRDKMDAMKERFDKKLEALRERMAQARTARAKR